jgi:beta-phosphoglucomutase-like phosphatase (HAD superfamily)
MIKVLMLDLGETLIHGNTVFPHVHESLEALKGFETAEGKPLSLCLVSDFNMPTPPATKAKIEAIFQQYLLILDQFELREFFEPVKRHVTLSTHAGVVKPNRQIFEVAIKRLGLQAELKECLFITEDAQHIAACRVLGMKTLQFNSAGSQGSDFSDWADAPLLIAHIVAPQSAVNSELGLKVHLSAKHGMELISMKKGSAKERISGQANKWHPLPDPQGGAQDIHVPLPVDIEVELDSKGEVREVKSDQPSPELVNEATAFVETLEANKQVAHGSGPLPPGTTHQVETDEKGQKRLVRKRFSAI